jgi:P-type E1-E2 ATPase
LTYGNLEVSDVISLRDDLSEDDLIKITASCEKLSEHPLAKAIISNAKEAQIDIEEPQEFKMYPGKGVTCYNSYGKVYAGNSNFLSENSIDVNIDSHLDKLKSEGKASIIVALNGEVAGLIGLSDVIREDSRDMIESLHDLGTETILLTGDNTETANYFASQVGIGKVYGNLLPEEKLSWIEKLKGKGKKVCMIGDGVNDAPALKTADVSVAMGSVGSDVAIEAADIALLGDDIGKIPYLKKLSNSTLSTIKLNIALSMGINAAAIICSVSLTGCSKRIERCEIMRHSRSQIIWRQITHSPGIFIEAGQEGEPTKPTPMPLSSLCGASTWYTSTMSWIVCSRS